MFALLRVLAVVGTIFAVLLVLLYSGYVGYTNLTPDEVEVGMHELVVDALRGLDRVAYVRYASVYRNFQDVGEFRDAVDELDSRQERELQARNQVELPLP